MLRLAVTPTGRADKKANRVWKSTDEDYPGFMGKKKWALHESAEAAVQDFKRWCERDHTPTQPAAAQKASTRSRCHTEAASRTFAWTRRGRAGVFSTVRALTSLLAVAVSNPEVQHPGMEHTSDCNASFVAFEKQHRSIEDRLRQTTDTTWDSLAEQRRAAQVASVSLRTARGSGRAGQVGLSKRRDGKKRQRPDEKLQAAEHAAAFIRLRLIRAREIRQERVALLKTVLLSGQAATLLRGYQEDETITKVQLRKVTTQGWALVKMYEQLDRLEALPRDELPANGVKMAACNLAGAWSHFNGETVRLWSVDFETNDDCSLSATAAAPGRASC